MCSEVLKFSYNEPSQLLEKCSYKIFLAFQKCIDEKDNWKIFSKGLSILGQELSSYEFEQLEYESLQTNGSPAKYLWLKLQSWLVNTHELCKVLNYCQFLEPLSVLVQPEPLQIIIQPGLDEEELSPSFDSKLKLICKAKGMPPPQYQWFHENTELTQGTSPELCIENMSCYHDGGYFCRVSQTLPDGNKTNVFSNYVNVKVKPPLPKIIDQTKELQAIHTGGNLFLRVFTDPPPEQVKINWFHNTYLLHDEHSSVLFIENLSLSNEGHYVCEVSNSTGKIYSENINVIVIPRFNSVYIDADDTSDVQNKASCKIAFLLANDRYYYMQNLDTPRNDVDKIAQILESLDFIVFSLCNLTKIEMEKFLTEFSNMVPPKSYIFFYYVGHGFLMYDKYLMPIDCLEINFLRSDCICDKQIMKLLLINDPQLIIFVLDMCLVRPEREVNPNIYLEENLFYEDYRVHSSCSVFEAFATRFQSYERTDQPLGIYANHLIKFLSNKYLSVSKIFLETHEDLIKCNKETNQRPLICVDAASKYKLSDPFVPAIHKKVTELFSLYKTIKKSDFKFEFKKVNIKSSLNISQHQSFINLLKIKFDTQHQFICKTDCEEVLLEWKRDNLDSEDSDMLILHNLQYVKEKLTLQIQVHDESTGELLDECSIRIGRPLIIRSVKRSCTENIWKQYQDQIKYGESKS